MKLMISQDKTGGLQLAEEQTPIKLPPQQVQLNTPFPAPQGGQVTLDPIRLKVPIVKKTI